MSKEEGLNPPDAKKQEREAPAVELDAARFGAGDIDLKQDETLLFCPKPRDPSGSRLRSMSALNSAICVAWPDLGKTVRLFVRREELQVPSLEEQLKLEATVKRELIKIKSLDEWLLKYTGTLEGGELLPNQRIEDDFFIMFAAMINGRTCNFILINPSLKLNCSNHVEFLRSVNALRSAADLRFWPKKELQPPIALPCREHLDIDQTAALAFEERKPALSAALTEFGSRLAPHLFDPAIPRGSGDPKDFRKWMQKVVASGAPGSGKSRLLLELATLNQLAAKDPSKFHELINNYRPNPYKGPTAVPLEQLRQRIAGWVPVLVTFNGDKTPAKGKDRDNPALGVALRMLYSHLCKPGRISFEEFCQCVTLTADPMSFAVKVILEDTKAKSIFLGIDEIMKLKRETNDILFGDAPVVEMLHQLTSLSLEFRAFEATALDKEIAKSANKDVTDLEDQAIVFDVVTSLNEGVMLEDASHSGVSLCSLPLSPLSMMAREKVCSPLFAQLHSEQSKQNLRASLADTGGRPGLVDAVSCCFTFSGKLAMKFLNYSPYDYESIWVHCRNKEWLQTSINDVKDLVCCSKLIKKTDPKCDKREVQRKISAGEVFEDGEGNIAVAPMAVANFADSQLTEEEKSHDIVDSCLILKEDIIRQDQIQKGLKWFSKLANDSKKVAMLLKTILQSTPWTGTGRITSIMRDGEPITVLRGNGFELYSALLFPLWSYGFDDRDRVCTIRTMLSSPAPGEAGLMCSRDVAIWDREVVFPANQTVVVFSGTFKTFMKDVVKDKLNVGTMVYCLGSNPGFESAIKLRWAGDNGTTFWLLVEASFSATESTTKFGKNDVESKLNALKAYWFFDVQSAEQTPLGRSLDQALTKEALEAWLQKTKETTPGETVPEFKTKDSLVHYIVEDKGLTESARKHLKDLAKEEFVEVFFLCRPIQAELSTYLATLPDHVIVVSTETLMARVGPTLASHFSS